MPGIDWLESQTTNGLNCSHFACFLRNSADYYPLLHAAAPPDLLFQLCKWQKSEIIVLLSPRDTQLSTAAHPQHLGARCPSWGRGSFISSFLHSFLQTNFHRQPESGFSLLPRPQLRPLTLVLSFVMQTQQTRTIHRSNMEI